MLTDGQIWFSFTVKLFIGPGNSFWWRVSPPSQKKSTLITISPPSTKKGSLKWKTHSVQRLETQWVLNWKIKNPYCFIIIWYWRVRLKKYCDVPLIEWFVRYLQKSRGKNLVGVFFHRGSPTSLICFSLQKTKIIFGGWEIFLLGGGCCGCSIPPPPIKNL